MGQEHRGGRQVKRREEAGRTWEARSRQREAGEQVEAGMGAAGQGGCQPISQRCWRHPGHGSHGHTPISLLVQGERGVPGRKGVKGQKGEPGPPGLDQPCPVVRVRAGGKPQPSSLPPPAASSCHLCLHCQGHHHCHSHHRGPSCSSPDPTMGAT